MKNFILNNIAKLPISLTRIILNLNNDQGRIFGSEFNRFYQLKKSGALSFEPQSLFDILNHALKNVPYYREKYGVQKVDSIETFQSLFGFTDKDEVLKYFEKFQQDSFEQNKYDLQTTGGTSGKPLRIYVPKSRYITELSTVHAAWARVGYNFDLRAVLRNHRLPTGKLFQLNPITKELQFDNFRLDDVYMLEIYKLLKKYNISYFHAYPSAAYQFATFCYNNGLDISFIKAFLSSSENIYEHQIQFIRECSKTRIFGFYGHTEKLIFGAYCEYTDYIHIDPNYGFFELIDEQGRNIDEPGKIGEMVGTTLNNFGMPLIRYKTGDFAEYLGEYCPSCGRKGTVLKKIYGRWHGDKIYNTDGTSVTATAMNLHSDLYEVINGLQYYQPEKGVLEVRIIKSTEFSSGHELQLLKDIKRKLAFETHVYIKGVEELELNKNGKFLLLKSDVKN